MTSYTTIAAFDALAVGRWQRTRGIAQIPCEQVGVEITADHHVLPLVLACNGSAEPVSALAAPFQVSIGWGGGTWSSPGAAASAPQFFDSGGGPGTGMWLVLNPWGADYVKMQ